MDKVQEPAQTNLTDPILKFRKEWEIFSPEIKAVLPAHVNLDAFKRVVITAVQNNRELLSADKKTFFSACLECAKQGLLPDGKEGALVSFGGEGKEVKTVSFMPMVEGIIKQIWRSDKIKYLSANAVYENDEFDYCLGDAEHIVHKPAMSNRGEVIAAYAIVKNLKDEYIRTVLTKEEIEKLHKCSRTKDKFFWNNWYDQMAIKSAIHRLSKKLDLSVEWELIEDLKEIPYSQPPKLAAPQTPPALPKSKPIEAEVSEPLISAAPQMPAEEEGTEMSAESKSNAKKEGKKKSNLPFE